MSEVSETISLSAVTTEVRKVGDGPPLLMISGLGTDNRAWKPTVDLMSGSVRCITYDNRGVGAASEVGDSLTLDALADDAGELIDALGEGPVHVCGVSMGGGIAMRVAARYPDRVRSLVLHATLAQPDARLKAILEYRMKLFDAGVWTELLRPFIALYAWSPEGNFEGLPEGAAEVTQVTESDYKGHLQAARDQYMSDAALAEISCPTLIVVGSEDIITPPDHAERMNRAIPGSRMITIRGAGHAYYVEDPEVFASIQVGWVLQHS